MRFARHHDVALLTAHRPAFLSENELMVANVRPRRYRPTLATISFDALEHNIKTLSQLIKPSRLAVAVKSNAYGHGIVPVSQHLEEIGVEMLCVATAEEALLLRRNGVTTTILLLSEPPRDAIGPCYLNDITFTVYSIDTINIIAAFANPEHKAHVHLKVDTGMNRVGVRSQESLTYARHISQKESIYFEGIYTHFATADDSRHPGLSSQLERFEKVLDEIEIVGLTPPIIHAANSAAAIRVSSARFNMCRVGIAAFGIYPEPRNADIVDLRPVMSLTTEVSFIKEISAGDAVSYGARYVAEHPTQIATLPIGYGDGVPRNLGINGGSVLIHSVKCPIVGNVTMDQMMVDVGNLSVNVGDRVTLWGSDGNLSISPVEWADLTGTISYEILCGLSERVERVYD